jgi:hypothetical protein
MVTTWRPCSIARSTTPAPNSTVPVTSSTTSTPSASHTTNGSSVTAGRPAAMQRSSAAALSTRAKSFDPGLAVGPLGHVGMAVGDRDDLHARHVMRHLQGDAAAHRSGADHPDPHGPGPRRRAGAAQRRR